MHELSIAMDVIDIATRECAAHRAGDHVTAVHVQVGALSGVVPDALRFSYDIASADTPLAGSVLIVEPVPVTVYCAACASEQPLAAGHPLCCPICGTPTAEVRHGRELQVTALEVEQW